VAQLQTSHSDPQVAAGLLAIAKLDDELREASLKVGASHPPQPPPHPRPPPAPNVQAAASMAA